MSPIHTIRFPLTFGWQAVSMPLNPAFTAWHTSSAVLSFFLYSYTQNYLLTGRKRREKDTYQAVPYIIRGICIPISMDLASWFESILLYIALISCLMVVVLLRCCLLQMAFLSDEVRGWNKLRWDEMGTWSGRWWPHIRWCLHPAPLRSSPIFYYYATKSMCMSFIFRPSSSVIKLLKLRIRR